MLGTTTKLSMLFQVWGCGYTFLLRLKSNWNQDYHQEVQEQENKIVKCRAKKHVNKVVPS